MKFFYSKQANKSGIYKIVNAHNDRIYIGQASQFKERWYHHKKGLLSGKRQNRFLMHDFNKCQKALGHNDFLEFHVLEAMPGSTRVERNAREEHYIAKHFDNQNQCYNFKQKSNALPRSISSKDPEATRKLLSEKGKGTWAKRSKKEKERLIQAMQNGRTKETYKKVSKALTGRKLSAEHIEKSRKGNLGKVRTEKFKSECRAYRHTSEAIEKIRLASKGRKRTPEWLANQSGINHWTKKSGFSKEAIKKMRESHQKYATRIKATNILTDEIHFFNSLHEAERNLPVTRPSVRAVLDGKRRHTKNFAFETIN